MEKRPCFALKLSLEEMNLRKMVVSLWMGNDILTMLTLLVDDEQECREFQEFQVTMESMVERSVSKLMVPETLKKQMMHIIRPIGLEIWDWKIFMEKYLVNFPGGLSVEILEQLCWTSAGAIDYEKTAENLVRLQTLDVVKRFELACLHCLADYIAILWKELPESYKIRFVDEKDDVSIGNIKVQIEFYWAYVMKGEVSQLDSLFRRPYHSDNLTFNQHAFEHSSYGGNKGATEYFFKKLTCKEQQTSLFGTVSDVLKIRCRKVFISYLGFPQRNLSNVLCYLLSVMTPEQQMQVFMANPAHVLPCFLDWPWQDLFFEMADVIWKVPGLDCDLMFVYIFNFIMEKKYYFPNWFQEFFRRMPENFRESFLGHFLVIFRQFSHAEDSETIRVVLGNVVLEDRAQLVSRKWFLGLLRELILKDKWHLVNVSLQEAALSREDRERLVEAIYEHDAISGRKSNELRQRKSRLMQCFELIDEAEANLNGT